MKLWVIDVQFADRSPEMEAVVGAVVSESSSTTEVEHVFIERTSSDAMAICCYMSHTEPCAPAADTALLIRRALVAAAPASGWTITRIREAR
ncbi:hypothetical protein [Glycomyces sp. NPDC048151]|uniref:hypothetical protein n=1 Tax=Glycomyces sp. NPDC048151 TaxID=3364002 RepID=UPI003719C66E